MNIKMILTTAVVASGLSLWGGEACKGPECPNVVKLDLGTVQSWDPNEIKGPEGVGEPRYVQTGDWMDYTIYFENKAEATAAAQEVFVTLPKDPSLDWTTLELGEVAFGANIDSGLSGKASGESSYYLPGSDGQVRTKVTVTDTEVKWYLRSWDPNTIDNFPADATAGFLPPNDATGRGEGHVRYRVRVKGAVAMGTVARACATIVFDQNDPITTDPAWWNTIGVMQQVMMVVDGVTTNLSIFVGEPYGELPVPQEAPRGYSFGGWFTGEGGTGREVKATTIVSASDHALYPLWIRTTIATGDHIGQDEAAPYKTAAAVYDGFLYDEASCVKGLVQVKVAKGKVNKKTGKFEAKVTATVQLADGTKKISFKGGVADETGAVTGLSAKGHALEVSLGVNGFAGTFDGKYLIDGVRNRFTSKDKTEKSEVDAFVKRLTGAINIVLPDRRGTLSVTIAAKGKAKIAGTVEGNKVSVTGQLLVGEDAAVVPVVVAKKVSVAFGLWINKADLSVEIGGLDSDLGVVGWAGKIGAGAKFTLDEIAVGKLMGMLGGLYADYLPKSVDVAPNGKKWVVADGAKAGKLVLLDKATGALNVDKSKFTDNMSGLKLTYKEKGGTFTGTFKVYNFENGKIKSYSANVTGVMIESKGYGTATIKKVGSVEVKIE